MTRADVTFITYTGLPNLDPDDIIVQDMLKKRGIKCAAAIWSDPRVNWSEAGICILRSTWDYHLESSRFLQWAEEVAAVTTLLNPFPLVKWNSHKSYLLDLQAKGAPVVPTTLIKANRGQDPLAAIRQSGLDKFIVKPAIGLATYGVMRGDQEQAEVAAKHVSDLLLNGDVLLQPYLESVTDYGEKALSFINGRFGHAVRKSPFQKLCAAGHAGESATTATQEEIAAAERVLACLDFAPLYARVDLVADAANQPLLLELELIEPSLFFSFGRSTAAQFADAIIDLTTAPVGMPTEVASIF